MSYITRWLWGSRELHVGTGFHTLGTWAPSLQALGPHPPLSSVPAAVPLLPPSIRASCACRHRGTMPSPLYPRGPATPCPPCSPHRPVQPASGSQMRRLQQHPQVPRAPSLSSPTGAFCTPRDSSRRSGTQGPSWKPLCSQRAAPAPLLLCPARTTSCRSPASISSGQGLLFK